MSNQSISPSSQQTSVSQTQNTGTIVEQKSKSLIEELLFEYGELRKEILQNDILTSEILQRTIIATGAVAGFAFSQNFDLRLKAILFIFTAIVCLIGISQNIDRLRSTNVIASYIKTYIEPQIHVSWETKLAKFRNKAQKNYGLEFISSQQAAYALLVFGNCAFSFYIVKGLDFSNMTFSAFDFFMYAALLGIIIRLIYLLIQHKKANFEQRDHFDTIWQDVTNEN